MDNVTTKDQSNVILETRGLTKYYGGVHALESANFTLRKGEHVAIVGDNGAGKSTFVRQITGVEQRTRGEIIFDGRSVDLLDEAREAGIETVFQTLAQPMISTCQTTFWAVKKQNLIGSGPDLDYKGMRKATIDGKQDRSKIPNIRNTIRNMSPGRQCVAIARTASFHSKLTIMDEPTAALGVQETGQVEAITLKQAANPYTYKSQYATGV